MVDRQRIRNFVRAILYCILCVSILGITIKPDILLDDEMYIHMYISIRQGKGLKFLFDIPTFKLICQCVLKKKLLTFGKFWILHYKPRSLFKR